MTQYKRVYLNVRLVSNRYDTLYISAYLHVRIVITGMTHYISEYLMSEW